MIGCFRRHKWGSMVCVDVHPTDTDFGLPGGIDISIHICPIHLATPPRIEAILLKNAVRHRRIPNLRARRFEEHLDDERVIGRAVSGWVLLDCVAAVGCERPVRLEGTISQPHALRLGSMRLFLV